MFSFKLEGRIIIYLAAGVSVLGDLLESCYYVKTNLSDCYGRAILEKQPR